MHQIRLQLGLRPRPRWESSQCSPDPLAGFKGPTSKGRGGGSRKGERKGKGGEGGRDRGGGEWERRGEEGEQMGKKRGRFASS